MGQDEPTQYYNVNSEDSFKRDELCLFVGAQIFIPDCQIDDGSLSI